MPGQTDTQVDYRTHSVSGPFILLVDITACRAIGTIYIQHNGTVYKHKFLSLQSGRKKDDQFEINVKLWKYITYLCISYEMKI